MRTKRDVSNCCAPKLNQYSSHSRGFSLVELLVVIAIVSILMILALPPLRSLIDAGHISQAATLLCGQFSIAQQKSIAENRPITLRLIRANSSSGFDRVQLVAISAQTNATPVGRVVTLPSGSVIARSISLSSLLSASPEIIASSSHDPSISGLGSSYNYIQFSFNPRGGIDLNIAEKWFATIVLLRDDQSDLTVPKNFATIQIDPVNGGLSIYRP